MKFIFQAIILIFSCFLSSVSLFSQAYHFTNYLTEHGQGIKQVRAMFQDSKGYLWFGSSGSGICRFDGKNYRFFSKKDGLCSDDINCIAEDSEGSLWFGSAAGISKFQNEKFTNFPEEVELSRSSVFAITLDKENNLWFGSSEGAYKYSANKFTRFTEKDGLQNRFIRAILCDSNGMLWFGTVDGKIINRKKKSFSLVEWSDTIKNNLVWKIYEDSKSNIWIGVEDGLWKYEMNTGKIIKTNHPKNSFLDICEDKNGVLWLGTGESGLFRNEGDNFINFSEQNGLESNIVYSIIEDREGNMWFALYGQGVAKLNVLTYDIIKKKEGFPYNFIWAVNQDSSENIWTGFNQPGISLIINPNEINKREIINFPTISHVYNIFFENENKILAGTIDGIEVYDYFPSQKKIRFLNKITEKDGLPGNIIWNIYEDKNKNLWIETAYGISVMNRTNSNSFKITKTFTTKDGLVNNYIFDALEDFHGNMWFATAGGVSKLKTSGMNSQNKFQNYKVSDGLANHDVRSIEIDRKGRLWFATGAGISLYDETNNSFKNFTSKDGLSSDRLYFLKYDGTRNVLWIGSAFGLDKFDLEEYENTGKISFTHPSGFDGFIEVETNTNSVCLDKNGNLWMGTIDGLIKYFPDFKRPLNQLEPITHITKITLDRKDTLLEQDALLPYNQNNFSFHFIGISLSMPERVLYQFFLDGFDNEWSPVTADNSATYSNLPPGNYTFKVLSANNDGVWNKQPGSFGFTISPPWWQTWWFRIIMFVAIVLSIWSFIKYREQSLKREKEILEVKVNQRTKQLYEQKEMVEEKNKEITDSILYAKRIQNALLASEKYLQQILPEHFIFFKPRDIVSGDFYWSFKTSDSSILFTLADCTGHGVPGAFMSMIGINKLNEIVIQKNIVQPDKILNFLRGEIIHSLNPDEKSGVNKENFSEVKDGMDAALVRCWIENGKPKLEFAGANNPVWIIRKENTNENGIIDSELMSSSAKFMLIEITPDIFPVGKHYGEIKPFSLKTLDLKKDDCIYLFSDGYPDQFGGPKGKKFKYSKFKELLLSVCHLPMDKQKNMISSRFEQWKGSLTQVDDVCVVGIKV